MPNEQILPGMDELRPYIGLESAERCAVDAVEPGAVRRFIQATMDPDPIYWDQSAAIAAGYRAAVAPPLYPVHMLRRAPGTSDPFASFEKDPDYDGLDMEVYGLPALPLPAAGALNGGGDAEFSSLAEHGDRVVAKSRYADIRERTGRSGRSIFVTIETTYRTDRGRLLIRMREVLIWR